MYSQMFVVFILRETWIYSIEGFSTMGAHWSHLEDFKTILIMTSFIQGSLRTGKGGVKLSAVTVMCC